MTSSALKGLRHVSIFDFLNSLAMEYDDFNWSSIMMHFFRKICFIWPLCLLALGIVAEVLIMTVEEVIVLAVGLEGVKASLSSFP